MPRQKSHKLFLKTLRWKWGLFFSTSLLFLAGGFLFISSRGGTKYAVHWGITSTVVLTYQAYQLWRDLHLNVDKRSKILLPGFGLGTWLSFFRLLCISLLAGFLGLNRPEGSLTWVPFALYLASNLSDLFDGFAARITGHLTPLGEKLDLVLDGRGLLIACVLAFQFGQAGWWFMIVGLARYLFVFGARLRRRRGLRVYKLKTNLGRRALAGTQMGLCTALLAPVFSPPETTAASTLFMIPFIVNFSYDWLQISGKAANIDRLLGQFRGMQKGAETWLPVLLRLIAASILFERAARGSGFPALQMLNFLLGFALMTGMAGRVASIIALVEIGFLSLLPSDWVLLISCSSLLFLGTGPFSLWKPEDYLIKRRLGEKWKK